MIWELWSPDAVANSKSSGEKARSSIALAWGRKARYAVVNLGFPSFALSSSLIPPSSSPIATRELATAI